MSAYYNEHDPKSAAWLRELIKEGLIAPGYVDERSIVDVRPHELTDYAQQHFFAGIGGWSYALRLAGWDDSRPVRTGSCPCQPFSSAGKRMGASDERHLWPVFRDLICFGEATITFGEQVASALGREWLAGVRANLEGLGYEVGAADLCVAGVGAPHIRQRLFWVANALHGGAPQHTGPRQHEERNELGLCGLLGGLADTPGEHGSKHERESRPGPAAGPSHSAERGGDSRGLGVARGAGLQERRDGERRAADVQCAAIERAGAWSDFDLIPCADGKARRIESGTFPLAHWVPGRVVPSGPVSVSEAQATGEARVARLRGYGNAIVPQLAAEFIQAAEEAIGDAR